MSDVPLSNLLVRVRYESHVESKMQLTFVTGITKGSVLVFVHISDFSRKGSILVESAIVVGA